MSTIDAYPVYEEDEFTIVYGLHPDIQHKPRFNGPHFGNPDKLTGVYAVANLKDGAVQWDYMTRKEIDGIRARSKASSSGPWVTDYVAMAKKTVIKRLCKMIPKSTEIMRAIDLSDTADTGKSQWTDSFDVTEFESEEVIPGNDYDEQLAQESLRIGQDLFDGAVEAYGESKGLNDPLDAWADGDKAAILLTLRALEK